MSAGLTGPNRPALVVMGVSGSGKTSVGKTLAARLGIEFVDGDDLHPPANVAKMSRGEALDDEDRWPWLDRVAATLAAIESHPAGVAVACSALRRSYRDRIREGSGAAHPIFLFLDITFEVSRARLGNRPAHFMPVRLAESQFDTLERPGADEPDVVRVEEIHGVDETVDACAAGLKAVGIEPRR